ncbi:hypothetical protein [Dyadobacter sp. LHD-138]|uniref:hypothetical protein n=1 Tax=Dyadobacter sp. LHD-138 TaxID=3071413 RepID=UPI0027E0B042|nr:hypothetical protein [Dyadobacter sp. LHD-138]MDQ6481067.1 hypothetical protein [Dyadobacter sp. LHD-138]
MACSLIVPLTVEWYTRLFNVKTLFEFFSTLTGYRVDLVKIPGESGRWGLASYANWGAALLIALAGATVWTFAVRKRERKEYNELYYWIRTLARYRIGIGIIAFGFLKLFPMQMPFPSISNLEATIGEYTAYKIYWQSVGVVIWYEIFLGFIEVFAGALMFFRATSVLGAIINLGVLYNIAHANHAYDGGVHVYSAYFSLLSAFVLAHEVPYVWKLLINEQNVDPVEYVPVYHSRWLSNSLRTLKYAIVIGFVFVYGWIRYDMHYNQGRLKEPKMPGLAGAAGFYDVTEFKINNKILPYSPLDTVRWQNVIFEKFSTLIYQVNRPVSISLANGTPQTKDVDRSYELAGIGGGRRFFYYDADTKNGLLYLKDKNIAKSEDEAGTKIKKTDKKTGAKPDSIPPLAWHFQRPSKDRIILSGIDDRKDSIYVVLDRVNRNYALTKSRKDHKKTVQSKF